MEEQQQNQININDSINMDEQSQVQKTFLQTVQLIWIDQSGEQSSDVQIPVLKMKQLFMNLTIIFYDNLKDFIQDQENYIMGLNYIMISSGSLGIELVKVLDTTKFQNLFIYCVNVEYHRSWAKNYPNLIKDVIFETKVLIKKIMQMILDTNSQNVISTDLKFEDDYNQEFGSNEKKKLGEGSFGKVYKIQSKLDGKDYAVKITKKIEDKSEIDLFLKEAEIFKGQISHPYMINYLGIYYLTKREFLKEKEITLFQIAFKMELKQKSLEDIIHSNTEQQKQPKDLQSEFKKIAYQMCSVLYYLMSGLRDQKQLFHLDIKPPNILYDEKTKMYSLADFGAAQILEQRDCQNSVSLKQYTPLYASPSVILKVKSQDNENEHDDIISLKPNQKNDIFSLGLTLASFILNLNSKYFKGKKINRVIQKNQEFIDEIQNQLSFNQNIVDLLKSMICFDSKQREDYPQLIDRIHKIKISQ